MRDVLEVVGIQSPKLGLVGDRTSCNGNVEFPAAWSFDISVQLCGQESFSRTEWNCLSSREQGFLICNLFGRPRSASPFEGDERAHQESLAAIYQLPKSRLGTLRSGNCINQGRGVEMNHSERVRRPPVPRAARISAISASTAACLRVGRRATIRSSTFSIRWRSSSLKRSPRFA